MVIIFMKWNNSHFFYYIKATTQFAIMCGSTLFALIHYIKFNSCQMQLPKVLLIHELGIVWTALFSFDIHNINTLLSL